MHWDRQNPFLIYSGDFILAGFFLAGFVLTELVLAGFVSSYFTVNLRALKCCSLQRGLRYSGVPL